MLIQGFLYFDPELLKCWSNDFSTSIWNCWNADQRTLLLQSRIVEMSTKGLLYFDLECWNVDQRSSLLQSRVGEMSIKGFLYFDLELLKCRSKVFSTSIWICWNVDQRSFLLQSGLLEWQSKVFSTLIWNLTPAKSQNLARLLNYESFFIPLFLRCMIFICSFWI